MQKSNSKKNINDFAKENFSNAFLFVQQISNVNISEWKTIILNNAIIFEFDHMMITRTHIQKIDKIYDENITNNFVKLIRLLLKHDSYAIQMRQKLIIFDMSHSHWKNEKKNIMTRWIFVFVFEFTKKRHSY